MKSKKTTLLLVIFTVLVIAGAAVLYNTYADKIAQQMQQTPPLAGSIIQTTKPNATPDFTVYDAEGNAHKLSDFKGKPVIVNFWTTWCYYCIMEMPLFEQQYSQYGEEIEFMMVNLIGDAWDKRSDSDKFLAKSSFTFPVYFDEQEQAAKAYNIHSIPVTLLIDADGNLVRKISGMQTEESLSQYVQELRN